MEDHSKFEQHLNGHHWTKAYEWLEAKTLVYKNKVARRLVAANVFGILMSVMIAFFTWVILYPSADPKELEAFPQTDFCNDLFNMLSATVPGGKPALIAGLIVAPFLVSGVLALISLMFRPKTQVSIDKNTRITPRVVRNKLESLEKLENKCKQGYMTAFFYYFLLICLLTGVSMVIFSVPGGLNPFEYIVVGAVCGIVQAVAVLACAWVFSLFCPNKEKWYSFYDWYKIIDSVLDKNAPKRDTYNFNSDRMKETQYYKEKFDEYYAKYTGTDYETPEERAKRIVREVEDELSGKGYGDY